MPRRIRNFNRHTVIDWRAQGFTDPTERLKFLRRRMGPEWPAPAHLYWRKGVTRRWLAPVLSGGLTVLLAGVLVSAFDFRRSDSMIVSSPVALAPPVALSVDSTGDSAVWLVDRKSDVETYSNGPQN